MGVIAERSFAGIPVETGAGAITSYIVTPARVSVSVRGPAERIQALTRDSLRVVAPITRRSGPRRRDERRQDHRHRAARDQRARDPDSVTLRRRTPPVVADVVLGIETSCDETSAAILVDGELASLSILSQDVHKIFGGVVPELASRAPRGAARRRRSGRCRSGVAMGAVNAIAVTAGRASPASLLVGVVYAKSLAFASERARALIGVHLMEGHLFAPALEDRDLAPPFVALLVSGGHRSAGRAGGAATPPGRRATRGGRSVRQVATLLGLGYLAAALGYLLAQQGDPGRFTFPRPMRNEGFEFSFSGLKTAVLHAVRASDDLARDRAHIARGFQDAVLDVLVTKLARAIDTTGYPTAVLGGGVACSRALSELAARQLGGHARVAVASPRLNTDNAAMIARAGWHRLHLGERSDWTLDDYADLPLPGLETVEITP